MSGRGGSPAGFARRIVAGKGSTWTNPPASFYRTNRDPQTAAETVGQVFLGVRLQCARCHNHPSDSWTQDDYYGFASFFTQVGRKNTDDPRELVVFNAGGEASVVVNAVLNGKGNYGFNAANDTYGDMIEMGILDPTKVTRTALQNAASVASLMLTTEAMVAEAPKDEAPAMPGGMGGGMGGMGGMDM